jgi:uncharacterized glyoxalase superfamily protein PhnB
VTEEEEMLSAVTLKEASVRINAHLCFDGQCEAAFRTYHQVLGGTIVTMLKYGESAMATQVEPQWHDRIVHATLQLGELELTGVDVYRPASAALFLQSTAAKVDRDTFAVPASALTDRALSRR